VTLINSSSENPNAIINKAVRDFGKNYKIATDEKWYKVSMAIWQNLPQMKMIIWPHMIQKAVEIYHQLLR
jgi:hypothetical protein